MDVDSQLTALFEAFNDRDWDAFDAVVAGFAPDFTLTLPRSGRAPVTRDAYPGLVRSQVQQHPDLRYVVGQSFLADDGWEGVRTAADDTEGDGADTGLIALTLERRYTRHSGDFVLPLCLVAETRGGAITSIVEYAAAPHD
jgi:ketosteroid isomerase-like protein